MWKKIPIDPLFFVYRQYLKDSRPEKINAVLGILLRHKKEYVMPSVQHAATKISHDNYGYLPMEGDRKFLEWARDFYLPSKQKENVALQQTAGGTHACWIMGQIGKRAGWGPYLIPIPTWENYFALLKNENQITFNHLNDDGEINWNAYLETLNSAEKGTVLILQATEAHNPTGKNLSLEQRKELIQIANKRKLWVYMDGAYIGLSDGLDVDKKWIKDLWKGLDQVMIGISFSKTATLYGHRLGALMVKCPDENQVKAMESYMQMTMRENISVPPRWGSNIMEKINIIDWENDIIDSQKELIHTRKTLQKVLKKAGAPIEWINALNGRGLFAILPIDSENIKRIQEEHGIYIAQNGRINISGFVGQEERIICFLNQ